MRNKIVLPSVVLSLFLSLLLLAPIAASAQVNISIGISLPVFPELVPVPGYPVYYAPRVRSNYFFYDGMYWVYEDDNWYASSWYNGPWDEVEPEIVPAFVLRIPVRYYRHAPGYFRGWRADAPPRWNEHWGNGWAQRRQGWDRWDRKAQPARPPLPTYQRKYVGGKYPRPEQQRVLQDRNYRYQPRDPAVRQAQRVSNPPVRPDSQGRPQERKIDQRNEHQNDRREPRDVQRTAPPQPAAPDRQPRPPQAQQHTPQPPKQEDAPQQRAPDRVQQTAPRQERPQEPRQERAPEQRAAPAARGREAQAEPRQESRPDGGRERDKKPDDRGGERGPDHKK